MYNTRQCTHSIAYRRPCRFRPSRGLGDENSQFHLLVRGPQEGFSSLPDASFAGVVPASNPNPYLHIMAWESPREEGMAMRLPIIFTGLGLALGAALIAGPAQAQIGDHMRCYKIKDTQKLKGTVDIDTAQFGLAPNCKISKASLLCVPADKSNESVIDRRTGDPVTPLPLSALPLPGDQLCYRVKCKDTPPPDTEVTDQFGTRLVTKFKERFLCTPAVKGTEFCGDGVTNGIEVCDPPDDGACPGLCQADCTCGLTCGDDTVNVAGEQCDGADLDGYSCLSLGHTAGTLACDGSCDFDTSGCNSCTGASVGGACWFYGGLGESCDTACANQGLLYDDATASYAGYPGGNLSNCYTVMDALGAGLPNGGDLQCFTANGCTANIPVNIRFRCITTPTTSDSADAQNRRACACK